MKHRLRILFAAATLALWGVGAATAPATAQQSEPTAGLFAFDGLEGGRIDLRAYAGRPILVVNTASQCGFAGQLRDLGVLWTRYRDRGLMIVAVPSNDFRQEPGDAADIRAVSTGTYGVTFPIAAKQRVVGPEAHPFYRWAARLRPDEAPRWNFHKYLIGPDGRLLASFPANVRPTDTQVVVALERALLSAAAD
jgi:glutathione peroxidase